MADRFILNRTQGTVWRWTELLASKPNHIECDLSGNPIGTAPEAKPSPEPGPDKPADLEEAPKESEEPDEEDHGELVTPVRRRSRSTKK